MKVNRLVDDLDGSIDDVQTRYFGLDGKYYEIDLSKENWDLLVDELLPFVHKGRAISWKKQPKRPVSRLRSSEANQELRHWARQNGWPELPHRGRVPSNVLAAYQAAHPTALPA